MRMSKRERKLGAGCRRLLWMLPGLWLAAGCSPELMDSSEAARVGSVAAPLETTNSLTPNGLSANGLSANGLSANGLSANGLSASSFSSWFNANPESLSDMLMKYLVRCAVPSGQSITWTNPSTGVSYTWAGALGLTPGWAGGSPATETEEQIITACLAAHVNKYGVSMQISLLGRDALGNVVPVTSTEASTYKQQEASFYGNLFRNEGVFVCKDPHLKLDSSQSTLRACSIETSSSTCAPIVISGTCGGSMSCILDSTKQFYATCSANGKAYQAVSTHIRPEDIYKCGDGVCQLTESCGTGTTPDSCKADCGTCP